MIIKSIHIDSFGPLVNADYYFSDGLNIIEGNNESGKSTIAMFIKFMLYGFTTRPNSKELSDKQKYVSWSTGKASGTMTVVTDKEYRIERELFLFSDADTKTKEKCSVIDTQSLEKVFVGEVPGEALLGMPEQIFINTAFVGQLTDGKINGDGMIESIENLLMSGDEGVSTKKALKKLDDLRVSLKHTRGNGGKLYELTQEKNRLSDALDEAILKSSDVIELETSIVELDKNISDRETKKAFYGSVCDAYKKIDLKRKLESVRSYAAQIEEIDDNLSNYDKYGNITDKIIEMQRLSAELENVDSRLNILRSRTAELENQLPRMDSEDVMNAREDVEKAETFLSKSKSSLTLGIICLVLMVCIVVANFFIPLISLDWIHTVVLGVAGLFALFGVISIVNSANKKKKCNAILEKWNVDSIDILESTIENSIRLSKLRTDPKSEYCETVKSLEITQAQKLDVSTKLQNLAELFTEPSDDLSSMVEDAVAVADEYVSTVSELKSKRSEIYGKYSVLSYILGEDGGEEIDNAYEEIINTDIGRTASALSEKELNDYEKNLGFVSNSLPQLRQQRADKDSHLSVLRATTVDPVIAKHKFDEIADELDVAAKRFESVSLAIDTIKTASENLRRTLLPRVAEESGKIVGEFSNGKYSKLGVDNHFDLSFEGNGKSREIDYLSAGTKDIAYISVRIALANALFENNTPPSVYDESFSRVDEDRLERILDLLTVDDSPQSLVFTCRKLEGEIARKFDKVTVINI